jgi:exodeoxyribonuclease VIII
MENNSETSVIYGLENEIYHAHDSLNSSGLKVFKQSPSHYQHYKTSPHEDKPYFTMGSFIHCGLLEPDMLNNRYFQLPEKINRTTKEGKAQYQAAIDEANGRKIITTQEFRDLQGILESVSSNKTAMQLLKHGHAEVSVFSEINGIKVRCRPDVWSGSIITDVKSTTDASYYAFKRDMYKYKYDLQQVFYQAVMASIGHEIDNFLFLVIEKNAPYGVAIYDLSTDIITRAKSDMVALLDDFKRCLDSGIWPSYGEEIRTIE